MGNLIYHPNLYWLVRQPPHQRALRMEGFICIDNILKHEGYMQSKGDQKSYLFYVFQRFVCY